MNITKWTLKNIALPVIIASLLLSNSALNKWLIGLKICGPVGEICTSLLSLAVLILPILFLVTIYDGTIWFFVSKRASQKIILTVEDMPSISRMSPLRVLIENKNPKNIICKAVLIDVFSPDESVRRYLGSKFSWQGNLTNNVGEKEIDAMGGKETLLLADVDEKESIVFLMQEQTKYRGKNLGKYKLIYEIRGKIGEAPFAPIKITQVFEVAIKPETNKRFIKSIFFERK
jgi:hypothetical protein